MGATKTTFLLDDAVRTALKEVAVRQGKSVTDLLTEGARLVLDQYRERADQDELRRRALAAREALREGLYASETTADEADGALYGRRAK